MKPPIEYRPQRLKQPTGNPARSAVYSGSDLAAGQPAGVTGRKDGQLTKPSRKEYLKLKARERRARERAAKAVK